MTNKDEITIRFTIVRPGVGVEETAVALGVGSDRQSAHAILDLAVDHLANLLDMKQN